MEREFAVKVGFEEQQEMVFAGLKDADKAYDLAKKILQDTNNILDNFIKQEKITLEKVKVSQVFTVLPWKNERITSCVSRYSLVSGKKNYTEVLRVAFCNLIEDMKLEPERFQYCKNCDKRFYQFKRKTMQYCSTKCSVAGRSKANYEKKMSKKVQITNIEELSPKEKAEIREHLSQIKKD